MDATPFAYIIYMLYLVAFLGILAGAIFFARGDVQKGKKYLGGAVTIVLVSVLLPYVLDYIYSGSGNGQGIPPQNVGNYDAYVNLIYPYPNYVETNGYKITLFYNSPMKQTISIIGVRLNFSKPPNVWSVLVAPNREIDIPTDSKVEVTVYYPTLIDNNGAPKYTQKVFELKEMVQHSDLNVITINQKNNANFSASYVIGYSGTSITYIISVNYQAPKSGGSGGGWNPLGWIKDKVAGAITGFFNRLIGWIQEAGRDALKFLPFLTGEEAMLYFTLLPTDGMLGSAGNVIHNFYFQTALPWGMVILAAITMLAAIERYWDGQDDLAFSLTKDVVGVLIWMFGGYYFYMAFAGFINSIIINIGIQYLLRMGYYIDLLVGMLIVYSAATVIISDNASGTYVGMVLFAIGMFEAMAFMRFFLIAAAVAMYPIIAPWGLLKRSGVSGDSIIKGIVKQGVYGITIVSFLRIVFQVMSAGNGAMAAGAMMLPIAFIFAPTMIEKFISAIHGGDFSHGTAFELSKGVKNQVQRAGLAATGAVAGKVSAYRANKHMKELPDNPAERISVVGDVGGGEPADTGVEYTEMGEGTTIVGATAGAAAGTMMEERRKSGRRTGTGGAPKRAGGGQMKKSTSVVETAAEAGAMAEAEKEIRPENFNIKGIQHQDTHKIIQGVFHELGEVKDPHHLAEALRRRARELEEHSKPSYVRTAEGLGMTLSGLVRGDVKKMLKGTRKFVGGLGSMTASAIVRGHIIATELSNGEVVKSSGAHLQADLARKAIESRKAHKEAAVALNKLADELEKHGDMQLRTEVEHDVKKLLSAEGIREVKPGEEGYESYRQLLEKRIQQEFERRKQEKLQNIGKIRIKKRPPMYMPNATRKVHIGATYASDKFKHELAPVIVEMTANTPKKIGNNIKSIPQKIDERKIRKIEEARIAGEMSVYERSLQNAVQSMNKIVDDYVKAVVEGRTNEAEQKKKLLERIQKTKYHFESLKKEFGKE